jgi:hypothetical protein
MAASSIDPGRRSPVVTRRVLAAVVSLGLVVSGVVLSQEWNGTAASPDAQATASGTTLPPTRGWAEHIEAQATLVELCRDGLHDPAAQVRYQQARAAQPSLANGIAPDCRLIVPGP